MVSHFTQGEAAARIALDILKGKAIGEIPVRDDLLNRFHFDYQELVRYGIRLKDLPPGSELINGPSEGSAVNKNLLYGLGGGGYSFSPLGCYGSGEKTGGPSRRCRVLRRGVWKRRGSFSIPLNRWL